MSNKKNIDENNYLDVRETRGLIIYPLPEEEFEYLCSVNGPNLAILIAELIEWSKSLDQQKLYGCTSEDLREKINKLTKEYFVTDLINRISIEPE